MKFLLSVGLVEKLLIPSAVEKISSIVINEIAVEQYYGMKIFIALLAHHRGKLKLKKKPLFIDLTKIIISERGRNFRFTENFSQLFWSISKTFFIYKAKTSQSTRNSSPRRTNLRQAKRTLGEFHDVIFVYFYCEILLLNILEFFYCIFQVFFYNLQYKEFSLLNFFFFHAAPP